jgi:hypothetical protein
MWAATFIDVVHTTFEINGTATCRPIARKRVDKHVSVENDSWKFTRYGTHFHGYEWSTNISLDTDMLYKRPFRSDQRYRTR